MSDTTNRATIRTLGFIVHPAARAVRSVRIIGDRGANIGDVHKQGVDEGRRSEAVKVKAKASACGKRGNETKRRNAKRRDAKIVKSYKRNRVKFGSIDAMLETIRADCGENFSKRTVENALKTARDGSAKR